MVKITDIKLLKLIKYFIVNKGYKLIVTQTHNNEVYLESLDRNDYQILYLTSKTHLDDSQFQFDKDKVEKIVKKIKRKTFKFKLDYSMIYTNNSGFKLKDKNIHLLCSEKGFESNDLILAFPDINVVIKIADEEKDNPEIFSSYIKEIAMYTQKKYTTSKKMFNNKNWNANKLFVIAIFTLNILVFILPSLLGIYTKYNLASILNLVGASSFEMVFINNQFWRPLISGFLEFDRLSLLINVYLFYSFGRMINAMYGNIGFFFIILLSSYFTQLLGALIIPGIFIFGLSTLLGVTFGSALHYAHNNRISFLKNYYGLTVSNALLIVISLVFGGKHGLFVMLISVMFGYLFSFVIKGVRDNNVYDIIVSMLVVLSITTFAVFGWRYLPKQHNVIYKTNSNYLEIYDDLGFGNSEKYAKNICDFYEVEKTKCPLYSKKENKTLI